MMRWKEVLKVAAYCGMLVLISFATLSGLKQKDRIKAARRAEEAEYVKRCFSKPVVVRVGSVSIPLRLGKPKCTDEDAKE